MKSSETDNPTLTERYFSRLGIDSQQWHEEFKENPVHAINRMISSHTATIPFENIDALVDNHVNLDVNHVVAKLLEADRGGYCHEHSSLLAAVLTEVGIPVRRIGARIYAGRQLESAPNKTHQALLADIDGGYYLIDTGFGGTTPLAAIPLTDPTPVATRGGEFRIIAASDTDYPAEAVTDIDYMLQFRKTAGQEFSSIYGFNVAVLHDTDIEIANFFTAANPHQFFTQRPVIALHADHGKVTLNGLTLHTPTGDTELTTSEQFRTALAENFGIKLSALSAEQAFEKAQRALG